MRFAGKMGARNRRLGKAAADKRKRDQAPRPDPSRLSALRERDDSYALYAVAPCHVQHIDDLTVSECRCGT